MQEGYLQLHFIPSLQSEMIPIFETYIRRSKAVVQISKQLPHLNFPIVEGQKSSYMFVLVNTGTGLNLGNLNYHRLVAERQPNLVLKLAYFKDLENVDPFNTNGFGGVKKS